MRNTWITYPWHEDSFGKPEVILDETTTPHGVVVKGGDSFGSLPALERTMSYQLVGEVTAHQGFDG